MDNSLQLWNIQEERLDMKHQFDNKVLQMEWSPFNPNLMIFILQNGKIGVLFINVLDMLNDEITMLNLKSG